MLKVHVEADCGNAPKKVLLRDFNIAYAKGDVADLLPYVAADIRWTLVGDKVIEGKEQFAQEVEQMTRPTQPKVVELTINNVLTHGVGGAIDGIMLLEDGSRYAYCDVYRFSSNAKDAKIKVITSYIIQT